MDTNRTNSGWSILPPPDWTAPTVYDPSQDQQTAPVQPVMPPPKTEAEWLDPHNLTDRLASEYQGEPLHQDPNLKTAVTKMIVYEGWKDRFAGKSPEAKLQVLDAMVDSMNLQGSAEKDAAKRYAWATTKDNICKSVQEKADTLRAEIEATRKQKVLTQMQLQNIKDMEQAGYDVKPANERMKQDELVQEKRKVELETKKTAIAEKQAQLRDMVENKNFELTQSQGVVKMLDAMLKEKIAEENPVASEVSEIKRALFQAAQARDKAIYEHNQALKNFSSFKPYMGSEQTQEPAAQSEQAALAPSAVTLTSPDGTKQLTTSDPLKIQKARQMQWK